MKKTHHADCGAAVQCDCSAETPGDRGWDRAFEKHTLKAAPVSRVFLEQAGKSKKRKKRPQNKNKKNVALCLENRYFNDGKKLRSFFMSYSVKKGTGLLHRLRSVRTVIWRAWV